MNQGTYDKQEAKRINDLPDSKLGEGGPFLEFDLGRVNYGDNRVTKAGYDGRSIYIQYETPDGWDDYLYLPTGMTDDGTIVVTDYPAGLMTAEEVYKTHTEAEHARSLEPVYDALFEVGVRFNDMDDPIDESEPEESEPDTLGLEEGDTLWRVAALRTYNATFSEQDPDEVIREIAEALVEEYPEKVNNAPVNIVEANLKGTPGIYDGTDVMNYHAMEVKEARTFDEDVEITIKDWKEEKDYCFSTNPPGNDGSYVTFEPLSALEKHLGVTILPVTDDD